MLRVVRGVGWLCIAMGAVVALYLVYSLLYTNVETGKAQRSLLEDWEREVGAVTTVEPGDAAGSGGSRTAEPRPEPEPEPEREGTQATENVEVDPELPALAPGEPAAVIQFHRPGAAEQPVTEEALMVVEGVSVEVLKRGPGHYPGTALPGGDGNFAVAGHRTTYGAPFFDLAELREGDEVHVMDRSGERHVYAVREQRVVAPSEGWVIGPDPLEAGVPTLTLTTCHPRFSDAERLIVFAELTT